MSLIEELHNHVAVAKEKEAEATAEALEKAKITAGDAWKDFIVPNLIAHAKRGEARYRYKEDNEMVANLIMDLAEAAEISVQYAGATYDGYYLQFTWDNKEK